MYTWGYLKNATLAKLDLEEQAAIEQRLLNRFPYFANEAMTQICSAIKPKLSHYEFEVYDDEEVKKDPSKIGVNQRVKMPDDFISFGDGVNTVWYTLKDIRTGEIVGTQISEAYDTDFVQVDYNTVVCKHPGNYCIAYNARWYTFNTSMRDTDEIPAPKDVLDCIPSYIAHQCYKIDDEVKASIFRNEYEMFLARIDNSDYNNTTTLKIDGGW